MTQNKTRPERAARRAAAKQDAPQALRFTRVNAILGVAGLATLGAGYWFLTQGSITAAPLLLVLAYIVLLPLAIIR